MTRPTFVSVFAGIGGFDRGLELAGWSCVAQIEKNPFRRRVLARHWPDVRRYEDVCTVRGADSVRLAERRGREGSQAVRANFRSDGEPESSGLRARDGGHAEEPREAGEQLGGELERVDLLCGGFPCVAAGTYVLAWDGYRPIESLAIGDRVLTHLGRWRRVTAVMSREGAALRRIKAGGVAPLLTTDEHPFYAREQGRRWNNGRRAYDRTFSEPQWIAAGNLGRDHRLAQVLPDIGGDARLPDLWWLVGRYLADGWRVRRRFTGKGNPIQGEPQGRVVICCAHDEAELLAKRIERAGYHATPSRERTVFKFHIVDSDFYRFLEQFGTGAGGKCIPGWVLGLDQERASALLEGWLSGDGWTREDGVRDGATISKSLALGMALLAQRAYGMVAGVYPTERPAHCSIEGRRVRQQRSWNVRIPPSNRSAFVEGRYGWKQVRSSEPAGVGTVYNISVEEDESYVADGAIVHNCQDISAANSGGAGLAGARSGLFFEFARLAGELRPTWLLVENVDNLLAKHSGEDFAVVLRTLGALGYFLEWRVLDSRYFGVPQRRNRVFLVGHLGGPPPFPVLFEPEGVQGHPAAGREAGAEVAGTLGGGSGGRGWCDDLDRAGDESPGPVEDVAFALRSSQSGSQGGAQGHNTTYVATAEPEVSRSLLGGGNDRHDVGLEILSVPVVASTLSTSAGTNGHYGGRHQEDDSSLMASTMGGDGVAHAVTAAKSYRLDGESETFVAAYGIQSNAWRPGKAKTPSADAEGRVRLRDPGLGIDPELAGTLQGGPIGVAAFDLAQITSNVNRNRVEPGLPMPPLNGSGQAGVTGLASVRRLTPLERERLQGFPDGWSCLCGCEPYSTHACKCKDGPRDQATGDAVTVPVVAWIGRRLLAAYEAENAS